MTLQAMIEKNGMKFLEIPITSTNVPRFWNRVSIDDPNGCWLWTGKKCKAGYGDFCAAHKIRVKAHRFAYKNIHGSIPHGLTLDHLCRNRACVNPMHLEPVSIGVNALRGVSPCAVNARKTHCHAGHPLHGMNLRMDNRLGYTQRICRQCKALKQRIYSEYIAVCGAYSRHLFDGAPTCVRCGTKNTRPNRKSRATKHAP